jgi:hypothetical protein
MRRSEIKGKEACFAVMKKRIQEKRVKKRVNDRHGGMIEWKGIKGKGM